jgi:hypothetical protein
MPGPFVLGLERTEIDLHLHLELAVEVGGYSPRVPAGAASPISETVIDEHLPRFVDNL